jgi:hypothetical protein
MLQQKSQLLLDAQRVYATSNSVGDLLWKAEAGWAECQESSTWGENIKAYLHLRAEIKLISSKLFINVTKATREDRHLAKMIKAFKNL